MRGSRHPPGDDRPRSCPLPRLDRPSRDNHWGVIWDVKAYGLVKRVLRLLGITFVIYMGAL